MIYCLLAYRLLAHLLRVHGLLLAHGLRLGHGLLGHGLLSHGLRAHRLLSHGLSTHGLLRHVLLAHGRREIADGRIVRLRRHLSVGGRSRSRARHGQLGLGLLLRPRGAILDVVVHGRLGGGGEELRVAALLRLVGRVMLIWSTVL